ncbi:hypothetical protein GCM10011521_28230 [Arenimonas soli]|uniref:Uncharacterized protein n=1 Tax=Arenimonas soli TaxID=2269504 RepID=A0ABQ1HTT8_9GAMM|nr:hypothetical protein GCM10011521_28230 [Arenimonas soli]
MNWLDAIGKHFDEVAKYLGNAALSPILPGDAENYGMSAEAPDGTWQLSTGLDGRIRSVFLFPHAELPLGISWTMSRHEARTLLGPPSRSQEGSTVPILGDFGPFDRFDSTFHCIHLEYDVDTDRLRQVTLMHPSAAP